jgi:GT2 family glycosyltransferase
MSKICTLMIVTFNRLQLTKTTIKDLYKTAGREFNLVIVDNGSTDGTVEYLKSLKDITLILNNKNKGIAIGRNIALLEADKLKTDYFCTADNDVKMPDGWLEECIKILEANKGYGAIGVSFEPKPYPLVTKNGYTFQDKSAGNLGTAISVFRKQLHQMIGFFNTEYSEFYGLEDSDFFMRARVAGFKLGYIEKMGIHLGEDNNEVNEYRKFKTQQHDSYVDVFKKNCGLYVNRTKPIYIPFKDSTP